MINNWKKFNEGIDEHGYKQTFLGFRFGDSKPVEFSKKDLNVISEFITTVANGTLIAPGRKYQFNIEIRASDIIGFWIPCKNRSDSDITYINIQSYEDEWYLLKSSHLPPFECDQVEGVINCLKKEFLNI